MMPRTIDSSFERMWAAAGEGFAGSSARHAKRGDERAATKAAVGLWKAQQAGKTERKTQEWKKIHVDVKQRLARHIPGDGADGIGAFPEQNTIGFTADFEPKLLQRRGQSKTPHWSVEQIEEQEQRDLVIIGRANGTWQSYSRWRSLFGTHAAVRSGTDETMLHSLLRKMVNTMRDKYAYGTITLLVSAVARAAQDFGWRSPRGDEVLAAMLKGVAKLKGKSKKKKTAVLGEHARAMMEMRMPKAGDPVKT